MTGEKDKNNGSEMLSVSGLSRDKIIEELWNEGNSTGKDIHTIRINKVILERYLCKSYVAQ